MTTCSVDREKICFSLECKGVFNIDVEIILLKYALFVFRKIFFQKPFYSLFNTCLILKK
jgi:hypothetical protein